MADILKVPTPAQLVKQAVDKIVADNVGITSFVPGSRTLSILECAAIMSSMTGMDMLEALRRAIPIMGYEGLGFGRKPATVSDGFFRFYRRPRMTLNYTGAGTGVAVSINSTTFSTVVTGGPGGENLSITLADFPTIQQLADEINNTATYSAIPVKPAESALDLFLYIGKQIVGSKNYLNDNGIDVIEASASAVTIVSGVQVKVDDSFFSTVASSSIAAGDATSLGVSSESLVTGIEMNISAFAVDTRNGKGSLLSSINGVEYVINDSRFTGGASEETDEERGRRFQTEIQGLFGGADFAIEARLLRLADVRSVTVQSHFPKPGTMTIYIDTGTGTISPALQEEISKICLGDPDDQVNYPGVVCAGMTFNQAVPIVQSINVNVTITRIGTLSDPDEIKLAVQNAIEGYINSLRLGENVVLAQIRRFAIAAHSEIYDIVISLPTENTAIARSTVARTGSGTSGAVTTSLITLGEEP